MFSKFSAQAVCWWAVGALLFTCASVQASTAISLTSNSSPTTFNFGSFVGTSASLPSGFAIGNTGVTTYAPSGQGVFVDPTSAYDMNNNTIYAGYISPTDNAFVGRVPGSSSLTLTFGVTNNTGSTLNSLAFTYNVYSFQDHLTSNNTITLLSDDQSNGGHFDGTNLTGNTVTTSENGTNTTNDYSTPLLVATETASYNQALLNGNTVEFQFAWAPGSTGGNRPLWGVDDFSIAPPSPTPEPASIGLLAMLGIGLLARRRAA